MNTNFEQVSRRVLFRVGYQLCDQIEHQAWGHVRCQVSEELWNQVQNQVCLEVRSKVWEKLRSIHEDQF